MTKKVATTSLFFSGVRDIVEVNLSKFSRVILPPLLSQVKQSRYLGLLGSYQRNDDFTLLEDSDGNVKEIFNLLDASNSEKQRWLALWLELDEDRNNKMSSKEFRSYLNLDDSIWSHKTFAVVNSTVTGVANFSEFLQFCVHYLVIDSDHSIEFSFRMISGLSNTLKGKTVLSQNDIKVFVNQRYYLKHSTARKRATELMQQMDTDSSGGLDIIEYSAFSKNNPTMLKFTQVIISHLRKSIFGVDYWRGKSRILRSKRGEDIDNTINELFDASIETEYENLIVRRTTVKIPCNY
jgi:Ca2+-binding EF-hand superfamily protein